MYVTSISYFVPHKDLIGALKEIGLVFGGESMEGLVSEARRGSFGAGIDDTHFPDMTVM
jgi:hypothetical protein